MRLLEQVFSALIEYHLVETAEEFSTDWCRRSPSWYAERKYSGAEFSVPTAIACLEKVKLRLAVLRLSHRRSGGLWAGEIRVLEEIDEALRSWLTEKHKITEVRLREIPQGKLLGN